MGMLGKYIDSLPDEKKDRIIQAQDWNYGAWETCLVGHAENVAQRAAWYRSTGNWRMLSTMTAELKGMRHIGARFDQLCFRHGTQRIVQMCKARAGRPQPTLQAEGMQYKLQYNRSTHSEV